MGNKPQPQSSTQAAPQPGLSTNSTPNPLRGKRLLAEAKRCASLTLEKDGVCIDVESAGLDTPWIAYIQGPLQTIWEGAVLKAEISFPSKYPWQPLNLRFAHGIFHPNVAENGSICNRLAGDHWPPALGPSAMLIYTRALLANPNFSARDLQEEGTEKATLAADEEARRIGGLGAPTKLYHYTCREAITSISRTWELKASSSGAAGPGVYATALHPTNCTKAEITSNNWGGFGSGSTKTEYVIELDVGELQQQGYTVEQVTNRDVWLIQRGGPSSICLNDSNSVISGFEAMSTCEWNRAAGNLFRNNPDEYCKKVSETVLTFGQEIPSKTRQRQACDE